MSSLAFRSSVIGLLTAGVLAGCAQTGPSATTSAPEARPVGMAAVSAPAQPAAPTAAASMASTSAPSTASSSAALRPVAAPSRAALSKTVPGDAAIPIVEFMPLLMRHEADLKLSGHQIQAFKEYREAQAPRRMALEKNIVALRGELRAAVISGAPAATREDLMQKVTQTELAHMQARSRCVDFVRGTLSADQYRWLTERYLGSLR